MNWIENEEGSLINLDHVTEIYMDRREVRNVPVQWFIYCIKSVDEHMTISSHETKELAELAFSNLKKSLT